VVQDLSKDDFLVFDQGQPRPIVDFSASDSGPASLALLFDISGSMDPAKVAGCLAAAEHVLSWLRPGIDEAAIFTFDTRLREVQAFTTDPGRLRTALQQFKGFGGTSLYDAIAAVARLSESRTVRRRGILVLSDGIDTMSRLTPSQVSGIASAIDVPVYLFAIVAAVDHPGSETELPGTAAQAVSRDLANVAEWTGGSLHVISAPAHASLAARELLDELRHQYLIAFEPAARSGWHRLEIRTRSDELSVRARSGYLAGATEPAS
jgi:VWFA-related protein